MSRDREAPIPREAPVPDPTTWHFRLYLAGITPAGEAALENLKSVCDDYLVGRYVLDVINLLENTAQAEADHIFAIPTVVRVVPTPQKKVIGDLSDRSKLLAALGIPNRATQFPIAEVGPREG